MWIFGNGWAQRIIDSLHEPTWRFPAKSSSETLIVEIEQEVDGRWLASIPSAPGVMCYGTTRADAAMNALILYENVATPRGGE